MTESNNTQEDESDEVAKLKAYFQTSLNERLRPLGSVALEGVVLDESGSVVSLGHYDSKTQIPKYFASVDNDDGEDEKDTAIEFVRYKA